MDPIPTNPYEPYHKSKKSKKSKKSDKPQPVVPESSNYGLVFMGISAVIWGLYKFRTRNQNKK